MEKKKKKMMKDNKKSNMFYSDKSSRFDPQAHAAESWLDHYVWYIYLLYFKFNFMEVNHRHTWTLLNEGVWTILVTGNDTYTDMLLTQNLNASLLGEFACPFLTKDVMRMAAVWTKKDAHILHNTKHWNLNLAEHDGTAANICKCYVLRCCD